MELSTFKKIKRTQHRHTPGISQQTGFPSPATHYLEPTIDLHQELITNTDATFFVRVDGNGFKEFGIYNDSVLIIDRSIVQCKNRLALVVIEGDFSVIKISALPERTNEEDSFTLWGVITHIINKAV